MSLGNLAKGARACGFRMGREPDASSRRRGRANTEYLRGAPPVCRTQNLESKGVEDGWLRTRPTSNPACRRGCAVRPLTLSSLLPRLNVPTICSDGSCRRGSHSRNASSSWRTFDRSLQPTASGPEAEVVSLRKVHRVDCCAAGLRDPLRGTAPLNPDGRIRLPAS